MTIGLSAWLLVTVMCVEVWYRAHETGEKLHWSFEVPASKEHFSDLTLPDPLGDERRAASWTDSDGSRWTRLLLQVGGWSASLANSRSTTPAGELPPGGWFQTPGGSGYDRS
jgi:hypothetical protein